jgi:DNA-binding LytR/AlgR family response regulator
MASWIDKLHLSAGAWKIDPRVTIAYLATCLLLLVPLAFQGPAAQATAEIVSARWDDGQGNWRDADLQALTLPAGRISVLKMIVRVDPSAIRSGEPLGLYLSGTFSAAAAWNGVSIGEKGRPGVSRAGEQPGLIDAVLPLPPRLLRPGENALTLRLSANYLLGPAHTVIHGHGAFFGLRVAAFSAESRRPIGYYAAPFLMSSVLLLALLVLALRDQMRSSGSAVLLGLLVADLSEVSRSVFNYPYPWHELRMILIALAMTTIALAILLHAGKLAGFKSDARYSRWRIHVAVIIVTVGILRPVPDHVFLAVVAAVGAVLGILGALKRRPGSAEFSAALWLMAVFAGLDLGDFMDRGVYAAAVPLMAYLIRPRPKPDAERPGVVVGAPTGEERLAVGPADARRFIKLGEVRAIHGAGDYAELRLKSGERVLHLETLQTLAARLPERFFRTHRSHIVNLDCVEALDAAGGGRYRVQLSDGDWMPVSRTRVAELRERLPR